MATPGRASAISRGSAVHQISAWQGNPGNSYHDICLMETPPTTALWSEMDEPLIAANIQWRGSLPSDLDLDSCYPRTTRQDSGYFDIGNESSDCGREANTEASQERNGRATDSREVVSASGQLSFFGTLRTTHIEHGVGASSERSGAVVCGLVEGGPSDTSPDGAEACCVTFPGGGGVKDSAARASPKLKMEIASCGENARHPPPSSSKSRTAGPGNPSWGSALKVHASYGSERGGTSAGSVSVRDAECPYVGRLDRGQTGNQLATSKLGGGREMDADDDAQAYPCSTFCRSQSIDEKSGGNSRFQSELDDLQSQLIRLWLAVKVLASTIVLLTAAVLVICCHVHALRCPGIAAGGLTLASGETGLLQTRILQPSEAVPGLLIHVDRADVPKALAPPTPEGVTPSRPPAASVGTAFALPPSPGEQAGTPIMHGDTPTPAQATPIASPGKTAAPRSDVSAPVSGERDGQPIFRTGGDAGSIPSRPITDASVKFSLLPASFPSLWQLDMLQDEGDDHDDDDDDDDDDDGDENDDDVDEADYEERKVGDGVENAGGLSGDDHRSNTFRHTDPGEFFSADHTPAGGSYPRKSDKELSAHGRDHSSGPSWQPTGLLSRRTRETPEEKTKAADCKKPLRRKEKLHQMNCGRKGKMRYEGYHGNFSAHFDLYKHFPDECITESWPGKPRVCRNGYVKIRHARTSLGFFLPDERTKKLKEWKKLSDFNDEKGQFTVKKAGVYLVQAHLFFEDRTKTKWLALFLDGQSVLACPPGGFRDSSNLRNRDNRRVCQIAGILQTSANSTLEMRTMEPNMEITLIQERMPTFTIVRIS